LRGMPPQADATALVALRAPPAGLLNVATVVSVLILGVLWWGSYRLDDVDVEASGAILLAAPTLLAAYIARPGEHELVSLVQSGIRLMVGIAGLLIFLGAGALAFGYECDELRDVWGALRIAAVGPATVLLISTVAARRSVRG